MRELPAAESHHTYAGGLLEHTVGVATLARETSQLHPRLRADLLLAAALLHDVGRVRELSRGPSFRATEEGRLLGHVHLGLRLIEERAAGLDRDALAELLHAVASHHDRNAARTAEAAVLYHANQLDAVAATRPVGDWCCAIALALGASLSWGLGDFLGGLTSRRMHVLTVLVVSQIFGLAAALVWVAASGDSIPGWSAVALATAAGRERLSRHRDALPRDGDRRDGNRRPDLRGLRRDSVRGRDRVRRATERASDRRHPPGTRRRRRRIARAA